jgi:tetratricopeptide (TPR) repeat protein
VCGGLNMSARRRKQKKTRSSNPPVAEPLKTAVLKPSHPIITSRRKWLFRLSAMIIPVLLFFAVLEAGLRLGGYGYATTFFVGPDAHGIYTTNHCFAWRFFPRSLARYPEPCFISAKPAGAVRIFVLGSSAAQGVPDPSFGFGRILEVMLRERYPETRFEVVNAAMTAINSHVALEIARDCAAHQPDLFIVYMGNNEVIGPYSPGTVFQQWSPNLWFVRASIWVKATRVGQLIDSFVGYLHSKKGPPAQWRGMQMFLGNPITADDPRLAAVYGNYRQNLIDICKIAKRVGAGVILSTVAVNLRDCPPLDSLHRADLDAKDLAKWESIYQAGVELEANGKWPEAIAQFEAAARIDDHFADLQFRIGRCLAAAGRFSEARDHFVSACDLDALRFRADSHINAIVREVAEEEKKSGVHLADAEQALAKSDFAPDGILGGDLFYEHVHLTFAGNYLLARTVFDQVCEALPKAVRFGKTGPVPSMQQCAESLVLTKWDECQMAEQIAEMTSSPPFTNQLDYALRKDATRERVKNLYKIATTPEGLKAAWTAYEAAFVKSPDDWNLHYRFAKVAKQAGRPDVAAEHLQTLVEKQPWSEKMRYNLGIALEKCGRSDEAVAQYQKALELEPDYQMAEFNLGSLLGSRGQIDDAIVHLQKAVELKPDHADAHGNLGIMLAGRGQTNEAMVHLQKALELKPDYPLAHNTLGEVLVRVGRVQEAIPHFERALQLLPDNAEIKKNLNNARQDVNRRNYPENEISHPERGEGSR